MANNTFKSATKEITLVWLRRDLRLYDHAALFYALKEQQNVVPLFIFDPAILRHLSSQDQRVPFIYDTVQKLKNYQNEKGKSFFIFYDNVLEVFKKIKTQFKIKAIYCNHDYEPQAIERDRTVSQWALEQGILFKSFKDQVIFEKDEIKSETQKAYTVYTPYKKKWLASLSDFYLKSYPCDLYEHNYATGVVSNFGFPNLSDMNFEKSKIDYPSTDLSIKMLKSYSEKRDFPGLNQATSRLGLHLRFGTLSVRELAREGKKYSDVWLSELIWRDFFMQILWHHPRVVKESFKPQYEKIAWRNNPDEIEKWKQGLTGYPLVDAGMRELNSTGHMHNRVRMVVASFLTKHLLHHWLIGERYFAEKLLDYDLSANNGNWQWAAGTGCDAAPYFRVFNPETQIEKFDPEFKYIKKWVPEFQSFNYVRPMVEHKFARERALKEFKKGLS